MKYAKSHRRGARFAFKISWQLFFVTSYVFVDLLTYKLTG